MKVLGVLSAESDANSNRCFLFSFFLHGAKHCLVNFCNLSKQAGLTRHLKKVDNGTIIMCSIFCVLWFLPAGLPALIFTIISVCASIYFFVKFIVPFNQGLSGDILGMSVVFVEIFSLLVITASFN